MPIESEQPRSCRNCGSSLHFRSTRDLGRKFYCSKECKRLSQVGRRAFAPFREAKKCTACGIDYIAVAKKQIFCSTPCSARTIGRRARERNNDLKSHLKRLLVYKKRKSLSLDFLLQIYEKQNGLCALTGIVMTFDVLKGRVPSNISIDRKSSLGGYTEDNVQLVCVLANKMKLDLSQHEFVEMCRKVVEVADAS